MERSTGTHAQVAPARDDRWNYGMSEEEVKAHVRAEAIARRMNQYGLSYKCARAIEDYLVDRVMIRDKVITDAIEASLKALHEGAYIGDSARTYASAWAYCIGFAVRDRGHL